MGIFLFFFVFQENYILKLNYKYLLTLELNFTFFMDLHPLLALFAPEAYLLHNNIDIIFKK